ncbi:unnamed protein product, partial [Mesorhabditis spiculigera]
MMIFRTEFVGMLEQLGREFPIHHLSLFHEEGSRLNKMHRYWPPREDPLVYLGYSLAVYLLARIIDPVYLRDALHSVIVGEETTEDVKEAR